MVYRQGRWDTSQYNSMFRLSEHHSAIFDCTWRLPVPQSVWEVKFSWCRASAQYRGNLWRRRLMSGKSQPQAKFTCCRSRWCSWKLVNGFTTLLKIINNNSQSSHHHLIKSTPSCSCRLCFYFCYSGEKSFHMLMVSSELNATTNSPDGDRQIRVQGASWQSVKSLTLVNQWDV